jgi:predicted N-formylglutamate amidohydrolase
MTTPDRGPLLEAGESAPTLRLNDAGCSPFLLLGDHAGNIIPQALNGLGLDAVDRVRHIAWDIGVRGLGELLAYRLDAVFLHQHYSRLVIDCNRALTAPDSIPASSDGTNISGNQGLSDGERQARAAAIHAPYHAQIAAEIVRRGEEGRSTIIIALHSFTPIMDGQARPWDIGILHSDGDTRFAAALRDALRQESSLCVGDNQPYQMDATDYTVPRHAFANGLGYAELEVRQDLIADEAGQRHWCALLSYAMEAAWQEIGRYPAT